MRSWLGPREHATGRREQDHPKHAKVSAASGLLRRLSWESIPVRMRRLANLNVTCSRAGRDLVDFGRRYYRCGCDTFKLQYTCALSLSLSLHPFLSPLFFLYNTTTFLLSQSSASNNQVLDCYRAQAYNPSVQFKASLFAAGCALLVRQSRSSSQQDRSLLQQTASTLLYPFSLELSRCVSNSFATVVTASRKAAQNLISTRSTSISKFSSDLVTIWLEIVRHSQHSACLAITIWSYSNHNFVLIASRSKPSSVPVSPAATSELMTHVTTASSRIPSQRSW